MVDPDIDIEYCVPEVATTASSCDIHGGPYILVKYVENKYIENSKDCLSEPILSYECRLKNSQFSNILNRSSLNSE